MMKYCAVLFFAIILPLFPLFSQSLPADMGARSKGLGNSNAALADEWAIFNNVGGISGVDRGVVFFGFDKYASIDGFDKVVAGAIHPFSFGNVGVSVYRFGDKSYNEQVFSIAFGNKLGFVRLGGRANYYQIAIDEFGSAGCMFFDFGGIVDLIPKVSFGAYISNFTASKLSNTDQARLPVAMKIGIGYMPIETLRWNVDLVKEMDFDPVIKSGIEYFVVKNLALRMGINMGTFQYFFGLGLDLKRFVLDYSFSETDPLGSSHQLSISFQYQKGDEK